MTELKYLEEVFPAYRAGRKLGYYSVYHPKDIVLHIYNSPEHRLEWFLKNNPEAIMDKGWCIISDLVSWPKAWEALKAGKRIKVEGAIFYMRTETPHGAATSWFRLYYRDPKNHNNETCLGHHIPIKWLDREDFEVVDD